MSFYTMLFLKISAFERFKDVKNMVSTMIPICHKVSQYMNKVHLFITTFNIKYIINIQYLFLHSLN